MMHSLLPASQRQLFVATMMLGSSMKRSQDMLSVLRLLRVLLPDLAELHFTETGHYLLVGRYDLALRALEEIEAKFGPTARIRALQATALFAQGNPLWESFAREARELPAQTEADVLLTVIDRAVNGTLGSAESDGASIAPPSDVPNYSIAC